MPLSTRSHCGLECVLFTLPKVKLQVQITLILVKMFLFSELYDLHVFLLVGQLPYMLEDPPVASQIKLPGSKISSDASVFHYTLH